MSDLNLIQIQAPELSSSNYGGGVKTQFDNIDKNFKTLGNHDFIKGDSGSGYNFELVTLTGELPGTEPNDAWSEEWVNYKIKTVILAEILDKSDEEKSKCLSTLNRQRVMVYYLGSNDSEQRQYVGIQPFPFYDGRLANIQNPEEGEDFLDRTGVICTNFEDDEVIFTLFNGFPSIYFDAEMNGGEGCFCWMIGEQKTGLPAQGPEGKEGPNGYSLIVQCETTEYNHDTWPNRYKITDIYITEPEGETPGMSPVGEGQPAQLILNELADRSSERTAIAFVLDPSNGYVYISPVITLYDGNIIIGLVLKDETTKVTLAVSDSNIETWLKNLNKDHSNNYHKGIFIPYVPGMQSDHQAHKFYSDNKKLIIEPIDMEASGATADPNAEIDIRYKKMGMQSSTASVRSVFNSLYKTIDGVSAEQRFTYVWNTKPVSGELDKPVKAENRPAWNTYDQSEHPFRAFMCPDGFLWYKDPYTYFRVELQEGKVMVIAPDNNPPATGEKTITQAGTQAGTQANPIIIPASESITTASLSADSYWSISKTS